MRIEVARPPIWPLVVEALGAVPATAVFTWGDVIYAPAGADLVTPDLLEHESQHEVQQQLVGGPPRWWQLWLDDPAFRFEQELHAYQRQYRFLTSRIRDRNARARLRHELAAMLAGPMYGGLHRGAEAYTRLG